MFLRRIPILLQFVAVVEAPLAINAPAGLGKRPWRVSPESIATSASCPWYSTDHA